LPVVAETLTYTSGMYGKELPENFMHTFRLVEMAASLGCLTSLHDATSQLGTSVHRITVTVLRAFESM